METTTTVHEINVGALGALRPGAEAPHAAVATLPNGSAPAASAAPIAPAKARKGARAALIWSGVGFLTGAIFWHAIGFEGGFNVIPEGTQEASAGFALADAPTASSFPAAAAVAAPLTPDAGASPAASTLPAPAAATTGEAKLDEGNAGKAPNPKPQAVYLVDAANCTALVIDRPTKRTLVRPCPNGGLALRLESEGGREDLADLAAKLQPTRYSHE